MQLEILKASGKHYTHYPGFPVVVGLDGVGMLQDGRRVYAMGLTGMMAEKALVRKNSWTVLPENLDSAVAAALPNALVGAGFALVHRAQIKPGQTILINGATGFTGKIAVQLARYYKAKYIIAVGRNPESLMALKQLDADEVVSLSQSETAFINDIREIHRRTPVDIVIDYLWGHPVELIIKAIQHIPYPVKVVTVGAMAGATINLDSAALRSTPIQLLGSGMGSFSMDELQEYLSKSLSSLFQLAADRRLAIDIETVSLSEIQTAWTKSSPGKSVVVLI